MLPEIPWREAFQNVLFQMVRVWPLISSFSDDSGDEEPTSQSDRSEIQGTLKILVSKLDDLSTCNDLIAKHGAALQRSLSELEGLKVPVEGGEKIKAVNERATLFRITSNAMINVSSWGGRGYVTHQREQCDGNAGRL